FGRKLISDTEGYIYLSGDFSKSLKLLDKETTEAVDDDFFIARLYDCEESPKVQLPADTMLCGTELTLIAGSGFEQYFWNQQPGTEEYVVDTTGTYTIEAIDEFGCVSMDTIIVNLFPIPTFDLGDTIFALKGEVITMDAPEGMEEYLWCNGSTLSFLDVNTGLLEAGNYDYLVEVEDENSCTAEDDITLIVFENAVLAENLPFMKYSEEKLNTDVENDSGEMMVNVYPNPARDMILISIQKLIPGSDLQLQILSDISKEVWSEKLLIEHNYYKKQLNISALEAGVYLLKIEYKTYEKIFKIVII
ncbi:MAG: T9SS type A sorting domain-containing protein, partial [Bacteroidales bacterium]|nr:T9SS type A sorting domain-containing protein [Bacteroidales bacterium]